MLNKEVYLPSNTMDLEAMQNHTDYVVRMRGRRSPLISKFITFGLRLQQLQAVRKIAGFGCE